MNDTLKLKMILIYRRINQSINQSFILLGGKEEEIDYKDKIYNKYTHCYNKQTNNNINCTTITDGSERPLRSSKSATTNKVK